MDRFLIDYIKSGRAWVLIGAGPSIEMGYPSWRQLASHAVRLVSTEVPGCDMTLLDDGMQRQDYPMVFENAKAKVGGPRLLQYLDEQLKPSKPGAIYDSLARWPVPVYLTTN